MLQLRRLGISRRSNHPHCSLREGIQGIRRQPEIEGRWKEIEQTDWRRHDEAIHSFCWLACGKWHGRTRRCLSPRGDPWALEIRNFAG